MIKAIIFVILFKKGVLNRYANSTDIINIIKNVEWI